jgi:hypothetical protein
MSMRKQTLYYQAEQQARLKNNQFGRTTAAIEDLDLMGQRLSRVRIILDQAPNDWAQNHWSQVEQQLLRKIQQINMELSCN